MVDDLINLEVDEEIIGLIHTLKAKIDTCRATLNPITMASLSRAALIRSVNSSLAIEGNVLSPAEMVDTINGKSVFAPFDEMVEVRGAFAAYQRISEWRLWEIDDLLDAYETLMFGLVESSGFRNCGVGVFEGERLIYKAPDSKDVPRLMDELFDWCGKSKLPAPVVASVVHFYIELIHPFPDGNGRIGRLWNTKVLTDSDPIYSLVPMETYIRSRQQDYYSIIEKIERSDDRDCSEFVKFCPECLIRAFSDLSHYRDERIHSLLDAMGDDTVTLKELMSRMGFSSRGKFMDNYLNPAIEYGFVSPTRERPNSRYQSYRRLV